jgi:hypothetical protein
VDIANIEIKQREVEIAGIQTQLQTPRVAPPDLNRLSDALMQRTAEWKADLRREPAVARLVLRRLIEPLTLWEESPPNSARPSFIEPGDRTGTDWESEATVRWEASAKPEALLDGLAPYREGTSPTGFEPVFWP